MSFDPPGDSIKSHSTENHLQNANSGRRSLQSRTPPRVSLTADDSVVPESHRRKSSSGSWRLSNSLLQQQNKYSGSQMDVQLSEPHVYAFDDMESIHPDGSLILR